MATPISMPGDDDNYDRVFPKIFFEPYPLGMGDDDGAFPDPLGMGDDDGAFPEISFEPYPLGMGDDDGAFPEISFEPYPLGKGYDDDAFPDPLGMGGDGAFLGMGSKGNDDTVCFSKGNQQGENAKKIIDSQHKGLVPELTTAYEEHNNQHDWMIPPCISNCKNPKGYSVPLDKRPAADGRELKEVQVNDNFATLWEALHVAEQKARDAITLLEQVQKELMLKEKEEQEMCASYNKVISNEGAEENGEQQKEIREERDEMLQRDETPEEPRCGDERERTLEPKDAATVKKSKLTRDMELDVSDKVDLGVANVGEALRFAEVINDHWLFDLDEGMDSGFATDDPFSIYDNGLFTAQSTLSNLTRPNKEVDMYGGADDQFNEVMKTERFESDRAFAGVEGRSSGRKRDRPMESDKQEEDDPFGLNELIAKATRKPLGKNGGRRTMKTISTSAKDPEEPTLPLRRGVEK